MKERAFTLYRIYYGDTLMYLGRTKQQLKDRIRGHLFKKPMHRSIDIEFVTKIEYATFKSEADMNLYEIYFINLWKPPLNIDDKCSDELTVSLPDVEWKLFQTKLWDKWKSEIPIRRNMWERERAAKIELKKVMREKYANEEITAEEYRNFINNFY